MKKIICFVGSDGAGKTTLAKFLTDEINRRGLSAVLIWSRFNNILSKPLLALARLCGHSGYAYYDGVKFGYHNFEKVFWLRWPFILLQMLDVNIAVRYHLWRARKRADIVVFERSPWDTLSDVILDTGCIAVSQTWVGRSFVSCVNTEATQVLWVKRSKDKILRDRTELRFDNKLGKKLEQYDRLAKEFKWNVVDNDRPLDEVKVKLCEWLTAVGIK